MSPIDHQAAIDNGSETDASQAAEKMRRMATVVRDSNDAITIQDFQGRITAWNRGAELMYGYSEEEALAENIERLTAPGKVAEQKDFIRRLIAGEAITSFETQRVTKDGRVLDVWMTVTKLMDEAGKPVGLASTERDITARKQAEETLRESEAALRASEDQFRAMFELTSVGMAQADPRTGQFVRVNGKMCAITGYSAGELLRMHLSEVTHPEDRQADWEAFQRVVRGEQPNYRLEKRYVRKDKSLAWVNVNMTIIRDAAGQPALTIATIEDIIERKQAAEAIAASELRYRRLFESAKDGILILDAETGMIVDVNPFLIEMLGFSREEFLGKKVWELGPFKDIVGSQDNFAELQRQEYIRYDDKPLKTAEERRIAVEFVSNVYLVNHQKVIQCNIRDITERKRAEEEIQKLNATLERRVHDRTAELEAVNKELEAFSYSVSHDLRAPLRAMDGFSLALIEDYAGKLDETAQDHLRRIRAGSERMAGLIDDLLHLSQVTRTEMRRERVDLTAMAEEIGAELQQQQPDREVEFVVAPGMAAEADARLLRLVLNNLLENAWKFTGKTPHAKIEFGLTRGMALVTFFVRDNGAGFDMAYADKLFGAFQRLHSTKEFEGTGIGLAVVRRIILRHGGRVWAEGAVGLGATVYFTLGAKE